MNKYVITLCLIAILLALLPFILIAKARVTKADRTRIHLIPDMDTQSKIKTQSANPLFADSRGMRPEVPGTVARGHLNADSHFNQGTLNGVWAETLPFDVTQVSIKNGQTKFAIYCAPCHGQAGYGDGIINIRAERLEEGTWITPTSLHKNTVREQPVGFLFNTITKGIRTMPSYSQQIQTQDRWDIVSYVKALQRSQNASLDDVPAEYKSEFKNN